MSVGGRQDLGLRGRLRGGGAEPAHGGRLRGGGAALADHRQRQGGGGARVPGAGGARRREPVAVRAGAPGMWMRSGCCRVIQCIVYYGIL